MKFVAATLASLALTTPVLAQGSTPMSTSLEGSSALSMAEIQSVSPALGRYAKEDVATACGSARNSPVATAASSQWRSLSPATSPWTCRTTSTLPSTAA